MQLNPKQTNWRWAVEWNFPLQSKWESLVLYDGPHGTRGKEIGDGGGGVISRNGGWPLAKKIDLRLIDMLTTASKRRKVNLNRVGQQTTKNRNTKERKKERKKGKKVVC